MDLSNEECISFEFRCIRTTRFAACTFHVSLNWICKLKVVQSFYSQREVTHNVNSFCQSDSETTTLAINYLNLLWSCCYTHKKRMKKKLLGEICATAKTLCSSSSVSESESESESFSCEQRVFADGLWNPESWWTSRTLEPHDHRCTREQVPVLFFRSTLGAKTLKP